MHKGDVMPAAAYEQIEANTNAYLIDVRTDAEWNFVGVPAVDRLLRLSWQSYPTMERNARFVEMVEEAGIPRDAEIYLICRSGARSAAAAIALTDAGFANCYNVAQGFEGDRDGEGHRGTVGGWKRAGLPWVQG